MYPWAKYVTYDRKEDGHVASWNDELVFPLSSQEV